uniref:MutL C-terminal dimerisation domain-containing protein n=1 Tax=Tetraselmis chuii TaxID=63592 RepID=A0A7S1XD18_9CHLO
MPPRQPQVLAAGEGRLVGTVPGAVTRRLLSRCTAIGQCDAQFIPAVCSNGDTKMLVIVDQHAADERVLLEELQAKLAVSDSDVLSSAEVHPPIRVSLGSTEAQALDMHASKAERWGWRFGEGRSGPSCGEGVVETEVLVTCVPCVMGVQLTATDLQLYLLALHETAGAAGAPAAVQRVLVSKACRGAIMFGDKLHQQECQQLLERLAETAMCFDCAHGRPTMAPLFDLRAMEAGACGAVSAESRAVSGGGSGDRAAKVTGERRLTLADLKQRLAAVRGANLLEPAGTG